jgi:hypothetical protein
MKVHDIILEGIIPFVPRATILANLAKIKQLAGKTMTPAQWTQQIAKSVRIPGVHIQHIVSDQMESGDMTVSAEYDEEQHNDNESRYIYVNLVFSAKDSELTILDKGLNYLTTQVANAIQHEMQHAKQYSGRGFERQRKFAKFTSKIDNVMAAQKYLGDDDEIDAFAVNIAHELVDHYGDVNKSLQAMRNPKAIPMDVSMRLFAYSTSFLADWSRSVVLKKLAKKIVAYLQHMEQKQ